MGEQIIGGPVTLLYDYERDLPIARQGYRPQRFMNTRVIEPPPRMMINREIE